MRVVPRTRTAARLLIASLGAAAGLGVAAPSQAADAPQAHHTVVSSDAIEWGPAPASLPPGARAAALLGSPGKPGPFVLRLRFPDGFVIPPHRHSKDEFVTVISGTFAIASGETLQRAALQSLPAASFVHLPAGMPHYAVSRGETIVQINGTGPFDVVYVDPKTDPRRQ